jgi:hypothetical protein
MKGIKLTLLIVWAVAATFAALVSTGTALYFWLQAPGSPPPRAATASLPPFVELPENTIPGRYRWVSKSGSESVITLNADHSFTKDDNAPNPAHRWELTRDALVIFWLRSQNRMNILERPGVYVETKEGIEVTRLEKQE